jgi:hypothetical protein
MELGLEGQAVRYVHSGYGALGTHPLQHPDILGPTLRQHPRDVRELPKWACPQVIRSCFMRPHSPRIALPRADKTIWMYGSRGRHQQNTKHKLCCVDCSAEQKRACRPARLGPYMVETPRRGVNRPGPSLALCGWTWLCWPGCVWSTSGKRYLGWGKTGRTALAWPTQRVGWKWWDVSALFACDLCWLVGQHHSPPRFLIQVGDRTQLRAGKPAKPLASTTLPPGWKLGLMKSSLLRNRRILHRGFDNKPCRDLVFCTLSALLTD